MNPNLAKLQPYPFERLRLLFKDITPDARYAPINLGIGEPKHPTPEFIRQALIHNLSGLASYPATAGTPELREAIAAWARRRYQLTALDALTQVLPVNGSREALFALAQVVVDPGRGDAVVVCPNPFYQIYEGAALLAGASPYFVNALPEQEFAIDYAKVPADVLARTQLLYVCSPGNPTGEVMDLAQWRVLFDLSDRHGFVIASDECYSEIYLGRSQAAAGGAGRGAATRARGLRPPDRLLQPVQALQRARHAHRFRRRRRRADSRIPALPHLPRQRHEPGGAGGQHRGLGRRGARGGKPPAVCAEIQRRARPCCRRRWSPACPKAAFISGARRRWTTNEFAAALYREYNVTVLPGSYLARRRTAAIPAQATCAWRWWPPLAECLEAAQRIKQFVRGL